MSGRHQISASGISLFDGVPFGRPPTRARSLIRPNVQIPPRKRRRLTYENDDYGTGDIHKNISIDGISEQLLLVNSGKAVVENPKIQDTQKQKTKKTNKSVQFGDMANKDTARQNGDEQFEEANLNGRAIEISKSRKTVRFADDFEEDVDDEENDEDFNPDAIDDEDSTSDEDFSDSEASEDSDTNFTSRYDSDSSPDRDLKPATEGTHETSTKKIDSREGRRTNGPHVHKNSFGASDKDEGVIKGKHEIVSRTPPGQGQRKTQIRNKRRHLSKKLRKLQSTGILSPYATVRDLKDWLAEQERLTGVAKTPVQNDVVNPRLNGKTGDEQMLLENHGTISSDSSSDSSDSESDKDVTEHSPTDAMINPKEAARGPSTTIKGHPKGSELLQNKDKPSVPANHRDELEERRQKLLAAIDEKEKAVTQQESSAPAAKAPRPAPVDKKSTMEPPQRRQRTDVQVANRLIFANLGLRAPKTEAEAESLKERLMNEAKSKKSAATPAKLGSVATTEVSPESDFWKNKIILSAVECCNDGIVLSSPPYPFVQRWDPQQQDEYDQSNSNGLQGRNVKKRNSRNSYGCADEDEEDHDGFHEDRPDETTTMLNYDEETQALEPVMRNVSGEVQPNNERQIMNNNPAADDLPALPTAVDTLKSLTKEDIVPGAIIAFKLLEVSKATNWAPGISHYRTAKILKDDDLGEGAIKMELAIRDREKAEYDEQGKRVFDKFEMVVDEDEQDDGVRVLNIEELIEPKLVQAAVEAKLDDE